MPLFPIHQSVPQQPTPPATPPTTGLLAKDEVARARQLADLKTGEPERAAHGAKAVQPGWQQVAALVLPLQSAKGIGPPVKPQGALAAHGAQHAFAGHAVEQRRSGQRRDYAELPRYHTVGQHESFPVRRAIDGGTRAPGLEQSAVGRAR